MSLQQHSNFILYKKRATSVAVFLALFLFAGRQHAYALTLSPARLEPSGNPGSVVSGEFTVINDQPQPQTLYASYENFTSQGENGNPLFSNQKADLDTWIKVSPEVITLSPGESRKVPYTITIPNSAEPGGYFAAIFWSNVSPVSDAGQVSIGAKMGLLVLLTVNGHIPESAGITQFDRQDHGFFYTSLPVDVRYKFRNSGRDRLEPKGTIVVRDTLFIKSTTLDANPSEGNVLPNSVRQFTAEWLTHKAEMPIGFFDNVSYQWQNFAIGLYSARLDLVYGAQQTPVSKTLWFFVFPWQLLICIIVCMCIVLWAGKAIILRYNQYIVKRALGR